MLVTVTNKSKGTSLLSNVTGGSRQETGEVRKREGHGCNTQSEWTIKCLQLCSVWLCCVFCSEQKLLLLIFGKCGFCIKFAAGISMGVFYSAFLAQNSFHKLNRSEAAAE